MYFAVQDSTFWASKRVVFSNHCEDVSMSYEMVLEIERLTQVLVNVET